MGCPLCGSSQIRKDYAPARGYVLAAVGLGMLFVRAFFNPQILSPVLASEGQRLLVVGVLAFAYGAYHLMRHGNRYCAECGFRFRATPFNQGAGAALPEISIAAAARAVDPNAPSLVSDLMHGREDSDDGRGDRKRGVIRYEPLLACLKFKDPRQRAEAARTLAEMTGQDFGEEHATWREWLLANKKIKG